MDWSIITDWLLQHGIRILIILIIGIILWFVFKKLIPPLVQRTVATTKETESEAGIEKRTKTLTSVLMGVARILLATIIIFMILSELDIPIVPALTGLGIAGVAFGFGAQYMVRDLIAGTFILMENQYRVGDVARVADVSGLVEEVNLRKTVLRDLDGIVHHVPNGEIRVTSNFTRHWARAHMNISVAYKEDLDKVMSILKQIWEETAQDPNWGQFMISKTPSFLRVNDFGDSGISIKLAGETIPIKQWDVMAELRRRIKRTFDEQGIEIPWPHTKVYFGNSQNDNMK
ncbi:MAG: mechanosensitive ion channel family protein [Dehalococcoidales bacterium]|nr:mechanosensitive ion channel family protein [Dehalococcoidales bacterium]